MAEQEALVKNSADPEQVKSARRKERFKKEDEILDLRSVLRTREGRRVLFRYLEKAGVYRLSMHQTPEWTAFNEGQRNLGLKMLADINEAGPEFYVEMMKENKPPLRPLKLDEQGDSEDGN